MTGGTSGRKRTGKDSCPDRPCPPGKLWRPQTSYEGVWELRIDYGPGYRIYFAKEESRLILLLIGGDKGSQKRDIAQATSYLQDHRRRN